MKFAKRTEQGRRTSNQDRVYTEQRKECFILAVADGMGGTRGGEMASSAAIQACKTGFAMLLKNKQPDLKQIVQLIFDNAAARIHRMA
jgi:serine/threonine protein phosphatase PrpC